MSMSDDLIKRIQGENGGSKEQAERAAAELESRGRGGDRQELLDPQGKPTGKFVKVDGGVHTAPSSEEILGKRKGKPSFSNGVQLVDGHYVSMGSHGGESGLVSSK